MEILITGGTGTISHGIVSEACRVGHNVTAITRGHNNDRRVIGADYLIADVWDKKCIKNVLADRTFDVVIECLVYNLDQMKISLENFYPICKTYVFISTAGVYERASNGERITESAQRNQTQWEYTRNKIICEEYLKSYYKNHGNSYMIIRPIVTYGDFRVPFPITTRNPTWTFFDRLQKGIPIVSSSNARHSIIHISDFSRAVVDLLNEKDALNSDFHISSNDEEVCWDDVIYRCGELLGVSPIIVHIPLKSLFFSIPQIYDELKWNKNTDLLVDDRKLKTTLKTFETRVTLIEGLRHTIDYSREEFIASNMNLDDKWNNDCDKALFLASKTGQITNALECQNAKKYIECWTTKRKAKICYLLIKDWSLHLIKRFVKKLL